MVEETEDSPPTHQLSKRMEVEEVVIHPLVLLSAADHYHRVAKNTRKRVVGILLGQISKGQVDVTNSYAVPFEENPNNPAIFYLDHNFLKSMLTMFRKINKKEQVVGFYSSGPELRPNDMKIYNIVNGFTKTYPAVYCIIDIRPNRPDLPVRSYKVIEDTFQHVPTNMGAMEAEEIGVEHLLRDIHDPTVSTCASQLQAKLSGLVTLHEKLTECRDYLRETESPDPEILGNLQRILALLPATDTRSLLIQSNDMHLSMYLGSLIRTVISLHDLLNNKIKYGNDDGEEEKTMEEEKKVDAPTVASLPIEPTAKD